MEQGRDAPHRAGRHPAHCRLTSAPDEPRRTRSRRRRHRGPARRSAHAGRGAAGLHRPGLPPHPARAHGTGGSGLPRLSPGAGRSPTPPPYPPPCAPPGASSFREPSCRPQDLDETLGRIHAEVERGFSTAMPMQFPRTPGAHSAPEPPDGLGWVVRLLARACSGLHMSPDAALDMPLDRLFALTAGLAATEGAHCAGEDYRDRSTAGLLALVPGSDEGDRLRQAGASGTDCREGTRRGT